MRAADELIGTSEGILALQGQVTRLLARQTSSGGRLPPILILGETGVGKGLLVRTLHRESSRRQRPLVDVNCAAIPESLVEAELFGFERGAFTDARQAKPGLFQAADGGVLFLDEIGMLPLSTQAKLLTALDQRQVRRLGGTRPEAVDTWVLSATNEDLSAAIAQGRFRADLYHRISPLTLRLPPLRERGEDVVALAAHFLDRACADYGLPPRRLTLDAQRALLAYSWPGNVRELANLMERVALLSEGIDVAPDVLQLPTPPGQRRDIRERPALEAERDAVHDALEATNWNLSKAAARLGVPRNTLRYRIERLGLRPDGARSAPAVAAEVSDPTQTAGDMMITSLRWERRWVTALRVALTGPADSSAFHMTPALERVMNKAGSFGATLDELHPAGFTAFYGLEPMEDAAQRAVLTAQAIHMALQRTVDGIAARAAVHVTECLIARGMVAPGMDTGDKRRMSEVLDVLLERAPAGTTVVSRDGVPFLRRAFELEALDADSGPSAYRVAEHVRAEFHVHGPARSPFVGRDRELSQLDDLLTQAEGGRGQLVGLVGEPGVGKSRLLYEFRQSLGRGRVTYIEGRCTAYGRITPYLPIVGLSHDAFHFADSDTPTTVAERVGAEVSRLGLETEAIVPYILHMLGLKDEGQKALPPLSPEAMRLRTTEALRQVLVASGTRRPMIVAIEDLQWIDPTSEEILGALAESIAACPILLLGTYRHGYQPSWLSKSYASQHVLHRLPRADSQTIVASTASAGMLSASVVDEIVARGDGNPFFLEELARSVSEGGPGRAAVTIPDTIQGVLAARLDRLPPADRDLLQAAAVLGKEGAVLLLRDVSASIDADFGSALARLRAAEFLHEVAVVPVSHYAFEHVLTQEVAYLSLPPDRRRALHATAARAIERLMPNVAERSPAILAHHCAEGGLVAQAIVYWHRAGQFASRRCAHAEAIEHLKRGLDLVETLPDTSDRVEKELGLRLALVASLIATQGEASVQVDATLARSRELVRRVGDAPQLFPVRFGLWRLSVARAQLPAAEETARGLLEIAQQADSRPLLMAAHLATGSTAFFMGQFERARSFMERSLTFHDADVGPSQVSTYGQNLEAAALGYLSSTYGIMGSLDQAAACADRGLAVARRCEHPFTLAFGLMLCGHARQLRREPAEIKRLGEELATLAREQGFGWFTAVALGLIGSAEAAEDPRGPGLDLMREGARAFLTFHRIGLAYRTHLGEALLRAGIVDEALDVVESTLAHATETGEHTHVAELHRLRGEAFVLMSRRPEAEAAFRLAFDLASRQRARVFALRAATALVKLAPNGTGPVADLDRLAGTYAGFTEGFALEDVRTARDLLERR